VRKRTGRFTARPARVRVARFGSDSGTGGGVREEVAEAVAYLGAEPLGPVPEVPFLSMVKCFACRSKTRHGPSYGRCKGGLTASWRSKTCVAC
jgi:hypothetical protein